MNNRSSEVAYEEKNFKKTYAKIFIILFFLCLFIVTVGISYAFFTTTVKGKEFVVYTGNLAVNYEKKTDVIDVENLYPMTNTEGLNQTPHEFSVTNSGNISARYQIRLELDDTIKDMVPLEYIKLAYSMDGSSYSSPILLSNLNSSLVILRNMILEPDTSNTFGIKLWIDLSAPNEIQGKTFKARIVVDSIQNVEDGYVVNTVPIITLNKDSNGNYDIHLQVNDTYTELGVEKVEDDNEILLPSQVVKTYEYYDGTTLTTIDSVDTSKTGIYYITYSITDSSNHVGKAVRIVTVNPTDSIPSITLNGESSITLGETDYYKEEGVTVSDNNQVTTIGEVKTSTIGTYIVRYIVVDSNGNLNSVIRTVSVINPYTETILNGTDPVLTSNLVPIQIADDGTVTKASTASSWYSYEAKSWANAIVLKDDTVSYANGEIIPEDNIESYFVWIPKYSYQLWDLGNYTSLTATDSTKPHAILIKFGIANTNDINANECTTPMNEDGTRGLAGESGNCKVGDYMTHPAFLTFNTNGLWIGKFETGYDGATSTEEGLNSYDQSDKIIIKPNVYSWRTEIKNAFKVGYEYFRNDESHIIKNTEWGAIAYLQHSIYGSQTSVRVNNNSACITGYAATVEPTVGYSTSSVEGNLFESTSLNQDGTYTKKYNTQIGYLSSTTGNISGIYDMSGGSTETVMAYSTIAATEEGDSQISSIYADFFTSSKWYKYYDLYNSSIEHQDFSNRILGDATGEMGPFSSDPGGIINSWYQDDTNLFWKDRPWLYRGGSYNFGYRAGIFGAYGLPGTSTPSFRIVLAPTK